MRETTGVVRPGQLLYSLPSRGGHAIGRPELRHSSIVGSDGPFLAPHRLGITLGRCAVEGHFSTISIRRGHSRVMKSSQNPCFNRRTAISRLQISCAADLAGAIFLGSQRGGALSEGITSAKGRRGYVRGHEGKGRIVRIACGIVQPLGHAVAGASQQVGTGFDDGSL
jgi:hypothetical protein